VKVAAKNLPAKGGNTGNWRPCSTRISNQKRDGINDLRKTNSGSSFTVAARRRGRGPAYCTTDSSPGMRSNHDHNQMREWTWTAAPARHG